MQIRHQGRKTRLLIFSKLDSVKIILFSCFYVVIKFLCTKFLGTIEPDKLRKHFQFMLRGQYLADKSCTPKHEG